jgi:hypothetical protein
MDYKYSPGANSDITLEDRLETKQTVSVINTKPNELPMEVLGSLVTGITKQLQMTFAKSEINVSYKITISELNGHCQGKYTLSPSQPNPVTALPNLIEATLHGHTISDITKFTFEIAGFGEVNLRYSPESNPPSTLEHLKSQACVLKDYWRTEAAKAGGSGAITGYVMAELGFIAGTITAGITFGLSAINSLYRISRNYQHIPEKCGEVNLQLNLAATKCEGEDYLQAVRSITQIHQRLDQSYLDNILQPTDHKSITP